MIGVLLAEDSASAVPPGMDCWSAKFNPMFDILGQLDAAYRSDRSVKAGESLHLFLPGVAERFAGQGIAQRLVAECVANGAHEGYRVAVTEATNRTSQHVFRKQALVERVKRSYRDYRFERQAVSASIAEQGGPR